MLIGFATDKGRSRANNQDAGAASSEYRYLAVADGLGGHKGGAEASNMAVGMLNRSAADIDDMPGLRSFMERANAAVLEAAAEDSDLNGMGTTMTAVLIRNGKAFVAHVGDSRAYMVREGMARQLTTDHSLASQLVISGFLNADEASSHPGRYAVVRCLGACEEVEPELKEEDVRPGDVIVLCTDGFWAHVNEVELAERFSAAAELMTVCEDLTRLANIRGGEDNITVYAARIEERDVR